MSAKENVATLNKISGFDWAEIDKFNWHADMKGESVPARVRQLDAKTYAVYRAGRYLGCENTLKDAGDRAKTNVPSEINREMEWQRAHPDEQPLGLRLTPEERAKGWQDAPARAVRAAVPPAAAASAPRASSGAGGPRRVLVEDTTVPFVAAAKSLAKRQPKADAGSKDTEIATLLKRGCTAEEVLRVTGWKAISMPAMAKKLGLGLRIDKGRKPFKYHGTAKEK